MKKALLIAGFLVLFSGNAAFAQSSASERDAETENDAEPDRALTLDEVVTWIRDGVPPASAGSGSEQDAPDQDLEDADELAEDQESR